MFDEYSGIVNIWVNLIKNKKYTVDDIPELDNLKGVVLSVLDAS